MNDDPEPDPGVEPDPDPGRPLRIDPELWLQFLLATLGDDEAREAQVQRISQKTGIVPENVEKIFHAMLEYLLRTTRSN
jgi:hypothetical protein